MATRRIPRALRPDITTWAELQALPTTDLAVPSIIGWVFSDDDEIVFTELRPSTDATDIPSGIARPDDYDAATNASVWFKISA